MSVRWLLLVGMRPFIDEVELLYEFMSVTGEATVMIMVCLNYFKSIPIPPTALLIASLLIVGGNLGAQVGSFPIHGSLTGWIAHTIGFTDANDHPGPRSPHRTACAPQADGAVRLVPTLHRGAHAAMDQVLSPH